MYAIRSYYGTDVKVLANFLLKKIKPVSDYFLSENPFEDTQEGNGNFAGLRESYNFV